MYNRSFRMTDLAHVTDVYTDGDSPRLLTWAYIPWWCWRFSYFQHMEKSCLSQNDWSPTFAMPLFVNRDY